jgi:hypothetical protein
VSFDPDIAAAGVAIVARDPAGSAMRWRNIDAGNPDVSLAVPAVVSALPDPVAVIARTWRNDLAPNRRGTDTNGYLSISDTCSQYETTEDWQEESFHLNLSPS